MGDPDAADPGRMTRAVADTLRSLQLGPEHAGIVELARVLAEQLDGGDVTTMAKLAPKLVAVLRELGATPAPGGRPAATGGGDPRADDGTDADADDELAELERNARTRADRAAGMDPAAT